VRITAPRPPTLSVSSHWNLPGRAQHVRIDGKDYRATIPEGRIPLPFLDINNNGRLDLDDEPTGRCRKQPDWSCAIEPARLTVHRMQRGDHDFTVAFGEVLDPGSFTKDRHARLCLADERRCVDRPEAAPFVNVSNALMIKLCDLTDKEDSEKRYTLELRSDDKLLVTTRTKQPPPMNLRAQLTATEGGYRLTAATGLPIHRVVVWSAEIAGGETKKVHWTSEENPDLLIRRDKGFEMRLPARIIEDCPGCAIGVQAVSDLEVGPLTISSEGVALLTPGGQIAGRQVR
jgi:hypothetical protein